MKTRRFTFLGTVILFISSFSSHAQLITTIASGLVNPIGITENDKGDFWVNEPGTGNNDSRVLLIKSSGKVYDVIDSLPSFKDSATGEVGGTWRSIELVKNKLVVVSGAGTSPYSSSLLFFNLSTYQLGDPPLTLANVDSVIHIGSYLLNNGFTDTDPFGMTQDNAGNIFVADAGADAVVKIDGNADVSVVKKFAPIPNIYTPFPDSIGPVPTSIKYNPVTGGFYLCFLTGFPFISGISSVVKISETGDTSLFATGLTQAVDMQLDESSGDLYVLQFATYDTSGNPIPGSSKIIRITSDGVESVAAQGFGPSAGMALDGLGGAYVTSFLTGQVLHISGFAAGIPSVPNASDLNLSVFPNPFNAYTTIQFHLNEASAVQISVSDLTGKEFYAEDEGNLVSGNHSIAWNGRSAAGNKLPAGTYIVQLKTENGTTNTKVVLN